MIIELSPTSQLENIIKKQNGKYLQIIPFLWSAYQCGIIQSVSKNKYNKSGLFDNSLINTAKWIETDPARTIIRLWRKSENCAYCGKRIIRTKETEGDHIVGRMNLNGASWQVPCCHSVEGNCQSSKGNRDLLEWWFKKDRRINLLQKDVFSVYIRGKYKVLKNSDRLNDTASKAHHFYLEYLWSQIK